MTIKEILEKTGWKLVTAGLDDEREVSGVYCGDLLSWVMGNGQPGQAWITVQSHMNVIAVASLREFPCVILAEGASFPDDVKERAEGEELILIESPLPVYETAKELMGFGL